LRPTFGRVSRAGAMALCWSLDKLGPICRGVEDIGLVLAAINGFDEEDDGSIAAAFGWDATRAVTELRVGYLAADFVDPLDLAALEAIRGLGVEPVAVTLPALPYEALTNILYAEAAAAFEELTLENTDDLLTRQDAGAWPNSFRKARFLSAVDHIQLDRLRRRVMQEMDAIFRHVDVLVAPAVTGPLTIIGNMTGHPSLAIRAGFAELQTREMPAFLHASVVHAEGPAHVVPHAIQMMAGLFDEAAALTLGRALEAALEVAGRRPPAG
jgi:Asp-tRNA(Asn)/Glu-tRNA(Gln) amidotransferase A subunit family amidase